MNYCFINLSVFCAFFIRIFLESAYFPSSFYPLYRLTYVELPKWVKISWIFYYLKITKP